MGLILVLVCTGTSLLKWWDNIEQKVDFNAFLYLQQLQYFRTQILCGLLGDEQQRILRVWVANQKGPTLSSVLVCTNKFYFAVKSQSVEFLKPLVCSHLSKMGFVMPNDWSVGILTWFNPVKRWNWVSVDVGS